MTHQQLIPVIEFCKNHQVEVSFLHTLYDSGLVEIFTFQQTSFINSEELPKLEQILLFNKELQINLEGIEVILRLLERVDQIQHDVNTLRNRLSLYENL